VVQLIDILWYKLTMWKKFSATGFGVLSMRNLFSFIVYAAFAVGAFYFARIVTWYLLDYIRIGLFLFHRFVAIVLFVFFLTVSAGNIVVSFSTLYRSPEMSFLLSQPVPYTTIFLVKFLDNFFYSSGTLFLASFAILLGYGSHFSMAWYFYPMILFGVMVPYMLLAGSLAVIVLLAVMKLAAVVNFRVLIGCVIAGYIVQIVCYFAFTSPVALARQVMQYYPVINVYYGDLDPAFTRVLPNYWFAQVLYFWITGFTDGALANGAALLLTSLAFFVAAVLLGGRYFYETWLTSISLQFQSRRPRSAAAQFFHFEHESRLSPHVEALLKKEYWLFLRDPSQWIHAVVLAGLLLVFLASVASMQVKVEAPDLRAIIYIVIFVFNAFLLASIALRFAFPLISLEGKGYWSMRSAPIALATMYWIKYCATLSFLVILGIAIWFGSNLPYRGIPFLLLSSFINIIAIAVAGASLNMGMGSLYADFTEKNPIRIASSQGATMTFLLTMVLLVAVVGLYFSPVVTLFVAHYSGRALPASSLRIAVGIVAAIAAIVSIAAHVAGIRALKNDF
jgi:ABC-2 type transport system permease protein